MRQTSRKNIEVVVADGYNLVRAGIVSLLARQDDMEVVGEASNGKEAIEKARSMQPDVLLVDMSVPDMGGIAISHRVTRVSPSTQVIMLTQYEEEDYIRRVIDSGISGYILKSSLPGDLTTAIRTVHEGKRYIDPALYGKVMDTFITEKRGSFMASSPALLTSRETEIVHQIVDGFSNPQIAARLFISVRTVEFHRANIMRKLGVQKTAGLVKYAITNKLIIPSVPIE